MAGRYNNPIWRTAHQAGGIDSCMGYVYKNGLWLHRLAELIPSNRFLGAWKVLKYTVSILNVCRTTFIILPWYAIIFFTKCCSLSVHRYKVKARMQTTPSISLLFSCSKGQYHETDIFTALNGLLKEYCKKFTVKYHYTCRLKIF